MVLRALVTPELLRDLDAEGWESIILGVDHLIALFGFNLKMGFRRAQHRPSDAGQKDLHAHDNDSGTDGAKRIRQKRLP